jgi:hypothetical protein
MRLVAPGPRVERHTPGFAGEAAVNVGHKGRALLVPCRDELDGAVEERIHDIDVLLARHAENIFDPFILEAFYKQLCGFHS